MPTYIVKRLETLTERPLKNVRHTGTLMVRLATQYANDVAPFAHYPITEYFSLLRSLPYHRDPEGVEFLQRPFYTLKGDRPGGDCDDKAIAAGAWAYLNGYPFRFVAMGRRANAPLHHVATDMFIRGQWIHFDPTYSTQVLGQYLFPPEREMIIGAYNGNA